MTLRGVLLLLGGLAAAAQMGGCKEEVTPLPQGAVNVPPTTEAPQAPTAPKTTVRTGPLAEADAASYFGPAPDGKLHVWFLDVGQGDAILIKSPTGHTVLVDGGPRGAGAHLAARLPELLHAPIDMVVVTHVHEDHYGGLSQMLEAVGVRRFLVPRTGGGPESFAALLAGAKARQIPLFLPAPSPDRPREPLSLALGGGAELKVLWPRAPVESHLPAADPEEVNSLVMRLEYGRTSLLLAGDATLQTERHLITRRMPLAATLLKVAAHGDDTATSDEWLATVQPHAAVITTGAGARRGVPARSVLTRLSNAGVDVFRTDLDGELRVEGDGQSLVLVKGRPAAGEDPGTPHVYGKAPPPAPAPAATAPKKPVRRAKVPRRAPPPPAPAAPAAAAQKVPKGAFVASRHSDVFHVPDCRNALRILEKNLVVYKTRDDAAKAKRPAGDCNP